MHFHNPDLHQINFLDERFYTDDDIKYYPSVTTVLEVYPKGYGFQQWLKDMGANADEVLRRAGDQGRKVHGGIEDYLHNLEVLWMNDQMGKENYSMEEWRMILHFVNFWETWKPKLITNEAKLISHPMRLGGTLDVVCEFGGDRWLLDAKTSNMIHPTMELQLAEYAMMWNEKNPELKIDRTGIVWLKALTRGADKQEKKIQGHGWQIKEFDRHYTDAHKVFEHVRAIWDEENPNYKPKNLIYPDRVKRKDVLQKQVA